MAQLNRLTAADCADAEFGLSALSGNFSAPAPRAQLTLISSQETGQTGLLTPNRRLGALICIASTLTFWSGVLALAL
jgi:hypothetical protein